MKARATVPESLRGLPSESLWGLPSKRVLGAAVCESPWGGQEAGWRCGVHVQPPLPALY